MDSIVQFVNEFLAIADGIEHELITVLCIVKEDLQIFVHLQILEYLQNIFEWTDTENFVESMELTQS